MSAEPPPYDGSGGFNPDNWTPDAGTGAVDEEYLATNYLQFPIAQGSETLGDAIISGTLTANDATFADIVNLNSNTTASGNFTINSNVGATNTVLINPPTTFNGSVNLGANAIATTQLSGNSSTLVATTAFVQDAVQVSGVQVGDSPLLWTGANTNQYNAGTGATLAYTYPYGLSQLYNISGGTEEFSLVANNGLAGLQANAFRIYCIQGDKTGTQISALTPQLILSNNGTSMQVKDGINIPLGQTYSINNVNILTPYSTTAQMNSAISTALIPYAPINSPTFTGLPLLTTTPTAGVSNAQAVANLQYITNQGFTNTTAVNNLITSALTPYATQAYVSSALTPYATTAYVNSVSPVYTQSSIGKLLQSPNSMFPTSQTTTTIQQGSFVQLTSTYFNITITSGYNGLLVIIAFSVSPWPNYPPSGGVNSYYITAVNTSIGGAYQCTTSFTSGSSNNMTIYLPTGAPTDIGTVYSFNLATMGIINA
jgi:hypothetical protein